MNWTDFKPKAEEENEPARTKALILEGMDPSAPIQPIKGYTPRVDYSKETK